jgi:hypothetical protein
VPLSDQQAQGVPPATAHANPGTIAGGATLAHGQSSGDDGATGREGERDDPAGDLGAGNLTDSALRRSGAAVSHRDIHVSALHDSCAWVGVPHQQTG